MRPVPIFTLLIGILTEFPFAYASGTINGGSAIHRGHRRTTSDQHCYKAGSSFDDPSCNCFGGPPPTPKFHTRPTIRVATCGWQGSEVTAHLLKTLLEEELGFPTRLIYEYDTSEGLDGPPSVWVAMTDGRIHLNAEVRRPVCTHLHSSTHRCINACAYNRRHPCMHREREFHPSARVSHTPLHTSVPAAVHVQLCMPFATWDLECSRSAWCALWP